MNDTKNITCRRCGECCEKGGPALHLEDLDLVRSGVLDLDRLVTLRAGEPVMDQVMGRVAPLGQEMVKVRGRDQGWTCLFLQRDGQGLSGCAIYANRPAECRALSCMNPAPLAAMYGKDRACRADILPDGHPLLELALEHEARCPAARAVELAGRLKDLGSDAGDERQALLNELASLASYDRQMRDSLTERAPQLATALDFFLGRPLEAVLAPMGLVLEWGPDGMRLRNRR